MKSFSPQYAFQYMFSSFKSPFSRCIDSLPRQQQVLLDNWLFSSGFDQSSSVTLYDPASFLFLSLLFQWLVLHQFYLPVRIQEICISHICLGLTNLLFLPKQPIVLLWSSIFSKRNFSTFFYSVIRYFLHNCVHPFLLWSYQLTTFITCVFL